MSDDKTDSPFTPVELEIAELAGKGFGHVRMAFILRRRPKTIEKTVERMSAKLPNPDEIPPLTLIQLWGAHRIWLRLHPQKNEMAG
jgi:hypothetical protein